VKKNFSLVHCNNVSLKLVRSENFLWIILRRQINYQSTEIVSCILLNIEKRAWSRTSRKYVLWFPSKFAKQKFGRWCFSKFII